MQTPQGFRRDVLAKAHASATGTDATDDAALVEAIGGHVVAVRGDERAFKVTVPLDLALAEAVAAWLTCAPESASTCTRSRPVGRARSPG